MSRRTRKSVLGESSTRWITRAVSDAETNPPNRGLVWQTDPVTFGRIIIGWRVGT
jgi:hypothetical protein